MSHNHVVVSTEWESNSVTEFLAVWQLASAFCKRHGFPEWEYRSFSMKLSFTGGNAEQARALMAAVEGLELPIRIAES